MSSRRKHQGRIGEPFVALPLVVLDSPAFQALSMHARALMLEVARQYKGDNNGRLLLSRAYMEGRGWRSNDMLTKAKRELLEAEFIFETVKGHRPHKASWYAITWRALDVLPGFDPGAAQGFKRGAFIRLDIAKQAKPPTGKSTPSKNASLTPSHGTERAPIAPPHGTEAQAIAPPHGAIKAISAPLSVPPHGHHLEMPSTQP